MTISVSQSSRDISLVQAVYEAPSPTSRRKPGQMQHSGQESASSRWRVKKLAALHMGPKDPWEKRKVSGTQNVVHMSHSRLKTAPDETSLTNQRTNI